MMGVDYELFWTLNPMTLSPFVKAFDLKIKHEDRLAWQNGFYIRLAIASCLDAKSKYPENPLMSKGIIREKEMSAEEIKSRVMAKMNVINARFGKE